MSTTDEAYEKLLKRLSDEGDEIGARIIVREAIRAYASKVLGGSAIVEGVPNKPKTPLRNVRIDDELWEAAKGVAAARGENVSEVIRSHLQHYVDENREQ